MGPPVLCKFIGLDGLKRCNNRDGRMLHGNGRPCHFVHLDHPDFERIWFLEKRRPFDWATVPEDRIPEWKRNSDKKDSRETQQPRSRTSSIHQLPPAGSSPQRSSSALEKPTPLGPRPQRAVTLEEASLKNAYHFTQNNEANRSTPITSHPIVTNNEPNTDIASTSRDPRKRPSLPVQSELLPTHLGTPTSSSTISIPLPPVVEAYVEDAMQIDVSPARPPLFLPGATSSTTGNSMEPEISHLPREKEIVGSDLSSIAMPVDVNPRVQKLQSTHGTNVEKGEMNMSEPPMDILAGKSAAIKLLLELVAMQIKQQEMFQEMKEMDAVADANEGGNADLTQLEAAYAEQNKARTLLILQMSQKIEKLANFEAELSVAEAEKAILERMEDGKMRQEMQTLAKDVKELHTSYTIVKTRLDEANSRINALSVTATVADVPTPMEIDDNPRPNKRRKSLKNLERIIGVESPSRENQPALEDIEKKLEGLEQLEEDLSSYMDSKIGGVDSRLRELEADQMDKATHQLDEPPPVTHEELKVLTDTIQTTRQTVQTMQAHVGDLPLSKLQQDNFELRQRVGKLQKDLEDNRLKNDTLRQLVKGLVASSERPSVPESLKLQIKREILEQMAPLLRDTLLRNRAALEDEQGRILDLMWQKMARTFKLTNILYDLIDQDGPPS